MDIKKFYFDPNEKPLDNILSDGGFTSIFRRIGCIGDSLSSGEFESRDKDGNPDWHDMYDYSWGQYIARMCGNTVYNFSKGGMTAIEYCKNFARDRDFWNEDKWCQAYIIALGVNDLVNVKMPVGTIDDIKDDWHDNADTFAGWYGQIIQRYREIEPKSRIFLMTMLNEKDEWYIDLIKQHRDLLEEIAKKFEFTYVLDFYEYGPVVDAEYRNNFYLGGHLTPSGYVLTAKMVSSYIDYIIRKNPEDFAQVPFIRYPVHYEGRKW